MQGPGYDGQQAPEEYWHLEPGTELEHPAAAEAATAAPAAPAAPPPGAPGSEGHQEARRGGGAEAALAAATHQPLPGEPLPGEPPQEEPSQRPSQEASRWVAPEASCGDG